MRKGGMTVRIAAAILTAAMAVSAPVPAFAAGSLTVETAKKGAVNGVSKVIGLEGKYSTDWIQSSDSTEKLDYAYVNPVLVQRSSLTSDPDDKYPEYYNDRIAVTGTKYTMYDSGSGLYKNGSTYYLHCENGFLYGRVAKFYPGSQEPNVDGAGLYDVDGRKYADCYPSYEKIDTNGIVTEGETLLGYYILANSEVEILGTVPGSPFADWDAAYAAWNKLLPSWEKKLSGDEYAKYYLINGKAYKEEWHGGQRAAADCTVTGNADGTYTATIYAYKGSEISFDRKYHNISWNKVTNETQVENGGRLLKVGYQVKIDGQWEELGDLALNQEQKVLEPIQTATGYCSDNFKSYAAGDKAKYEVRAVYYTEMAAAADETSEYFNGLISKQIVKAGEWSELTYHWAQEQVYIPVVKGLKWVQKNAEYARISWNAVLEASNYKVQSYKSAVPVDPSKLKEGVWTDIGTTGMRTYYDCANRETEYVDERDENGNIKYDGEGNKIRKEANYIYFRVCAVVVDSNEDYVEGNYCQPCVITYNKQINAPTVTGLKAEHMEDGTFRLAWNPIDVNTNAVVLYSKNEGIFKSPEYMYKYLNAAGVDSLGRTQDLTSVTALKDKMELAAKQVKEYPVSASQNYISSNVLELEPGKKYYFVVLTYDASRHDEARPGSPYKANVVVNGKTEQVTFVNYNDVASSKTIDAALGLGIEAPTTKSGKKNITMIFEQTNSAVTGYEIYRKNGKKYKKIRTISSTEYTDEGLNESTVYDYRARAYYYNPETKAKKVYSDYVYFSAETGNSNYIDLRVTKKSKTSATLKWTKVSGAVQYDIYRAYLSSTDTSFSKSNGFGNYPKQQSNKKFELVKTIKKAKTVTWTDKKLKKDASYTYVVVASYQSKKLTKQIYAVDSVVMKVEKPKNVRTSVIGKNVKVTWDKDKFASKYEISYRKYDNRDDYDGGYYGAYEDHWKTVDNIKKNSYTIQNVAGNESVAIRIRAYGSNKWSEYATAEQNGNEKLRIAQSVTAKEITEKNAKGTSAAAVKISWKKVSGAKYYKVWRSTSPASFYNTDKRSYETNGRVEPIAKESNSDESISANVVLYKEYKFRNNTIMATSAIDRGNLRTGVTYYYYVQAFGENGDTISGLSKPAAICYKVSPSITKLTAKKGRITVKIAKVNGASKYEVYRSDNKNKGFEKIGATKKNSTSFTDKKVKKGKKYYYKVVAVGTNGLKADFVSGASKAKSIKAK